MDRLLARITHDFFSKSKGKRLWSAKDTVDAKSCIAARGISMTECSTEITRFPLAQKPVTIRNDGGALTSDAGVLLLRQLDDRLGLTRRLAGCVVDRRE